MSCLCIGQDNSRWHENTLKPCSNRCVYLGKSPCHASNEPLVLNPSTGAITGQFHVVMDDWFATIVSTTTALPDFNIDEWRKVFEDSDFQYMSDDGVTVPEDVEQSQRNHDLAISHQNQITEAMTYTKPVVSLLNLLQNPLHCLTHQLHQLLLHLCQL